MRTSLIGAPLIVSDLPPSRLAVALALAVNAALLTAGVTLPLAVFAFLMSSGAVSGDGGFWVRFVVVTFAWSLLISWLAYRRVSRGDDNRGGGSTFRPNMP